MSSSYSGEAIGWMAALASMMAFGSFGVPIKSDASNSVDIDPLVFQSYKSAMCFLTSWLVLLWGVPFSYTPWGIVSCIFWVPGGVATVFAIRNAGLAIAIGIGSSTIVLVSFIWGIFIFEEEIHSRWGACFAIAMMMGGISGMAYFSSPQIGDGEQQQQELVTSHHSDDNNNDHDQTRFVSMPQQSDELDGMSHSNNSSSHRRRHPASHSNSQKGGYTSVDVQPLEGPLQEPQSVPPQPLQDNLPEDIITMITTNKQPAIHTTARTEICDSISTAYPEEEFPPAYYTSQSLPQSGGTTRDPLERLYICGIPFTRRQVGIAGAVFNGVWGGSIMAPMKWCNTSTSGVGYLISFGIGAAVVTTALWVLRLAGNLWYYRGSLTRAYQALPSFHLRVMWCAGGTSGLLWSIGNFFSLISVHYLGEGVGYSVVQAGMLISGLWGIFYFKEVTGAQVITKWLASACVTICGIILLSYEHHHK